MDDEVLIASLLAQELLELGAAEAFEAHGRAEAVAILRDHPEIAAMVCDVRMPGMDGTVLARQALALAPSLKVVFVTGYSAGLDTGCWPVLDKPVDPDRLAATLRRLLGP